MDDKRKEMYTNLERHVCQSWQEGDWVIFRCTECYFKRKLNWKTGEVKLINPGQFDALHSGMNIPFQQEHIQIESN